LIGTPAIFFFDRWRVELYRAFFSPATQRDHPTLKNPAANNLRLTLENLDIPELVRQPAAPCLRRSSSHSPDTHLQPHSSEIHTAGRAGQPLTLLAQRYQQIAGSPV